MILLINKIHFSFNLSLINDVHVCLLVPAGGGSSALFHIGALYQCASLSVDQSSRLQAVGESPLRVQW